MSETITVTFELEREAHKKMLKLSEEGYRTLAAECRLAVDEHLDSTGKKIRRKDD